MAMQSKGVLHDGRMAILAVNAGSSSLKFSLHPRRGSRVLEYVLSGRVEGLEPGGAPTLLWSWQGRKQKQTLPASERPFDTALQHLHDLLSTLPDAPALQAVAHRVVHGGTAFRESVLVTPEVLDALTALQPLAPLHQPHNVQGLRVFQATFPALPQVACFDTGFHASMPAVEYRYALPTAMLDEGLRRYGFHGLSYRYLMSQLQAHSPRAEGRVLMAHLGNGASLCAALQGRSVASTMGFSALDGLVMGTRCGALDPGVLLYLMARGWTAERLQALLYSQSGLLGISGVSADMRRLRADGSEGAALAISMFTHRVVREAGAMAACLQGLDVLAFSGGIGEHDAALRADVAARLGWMGVRLDDAANKLATGGTLTPIHAPGSTVEVWVVPTDEGRVAAGDAAALLAGAGR